MKQVSVIIVTYNSEKDIYDCVDSIQTHADIPKDDIELIIVDNCSREPEPMFSRLRRSGARTSSLLRTHKTAATDRATTSESAAPQHLSSSS
jgi:GT2 family glycosyltransferase